MTVEVAKDETITNGIFYTRLSVLVWEQKDENGSLCYHYRNGGFGRA